MKAGYGPGSARAGKQEGGATSSQMVALDCRSRSLCCLELTELHWQSRECAFLRERLVTLVSNLHDLARFTR